MRLKMQTKMLKKLDKLLGDDGSAVRQQCYIAVGKTAKRLKGKMARDLRTVCQLPTETCKKFIRTKAKPFPVLEATVTLKKSKRISLRHFKPKQSKTGTSVVIDKTDGRTNVQSAFMGPKPGMVAIKLKGNVFRRTTFSRKPIELLKIDPPARLFIDANLVAPSVQFAQDILNKEVQRRIQFLTYKLNKG